MIASESHSLLNSICARATRRVETAADRAEKPLVVLTAVPWSFHFS
jgi:hypothetical protein